jgi:GxxExxY protein
MNADTLNALSERIIGCGLVVANRLGSGFLEKIYENAPAHELRKAGLTVAQQQGVSVTYDEVIVGEYAADLLVEAAVVVELKAVRALDDIHQAQCMNYLRATACIFACTGTSASRAWRPGGSSVTSDRICVHLRFDLLRNARRQERVSAGAR